MSNFRLFFSGIKEGFKNFGNLVTNIINSILLFFVYIIGVGLTSIVAKISRKGFLDIKKKKVDSYWNNLNLKKKPIEKYYRQF